MYRPPWPQIKTRNCSALSTTPPFYQRIKTFHHRLFKLNPPRARSLHQRPHPPPKPLRHLPHPRGLTAWYPPHPRVSRKQIQISSSRRAERPPSKHSIHPIKHRQAAGLQPKPLSPRGPIPLHHSFPWAFTLNTWCRRKPCCLNKLGGRSPQTQFRAETPPRIRRTSRGPPPFHPQSELRSFNLPQGPS